MGQTTRNMPGDAEPETGARDGQPGAREGEAALQVLVLDPYGRNAGLICETLRAAGLRCRVAPRMDALLAALDAGAGALVLSPRALDGERAPRLRAALEAQAAWSDIPLILLLGQDEGEDALDMIGGRLGNRANLVALHKPLWPASLVTAVQMALRARRRQVELRALYETLEQRVAERTETVRRLTAELTRAEQQERQRISQILHDELQQLLYSMQIQLQMVDATLSAEEQPQVAADLEEMAAGLAEATALTRTLTVELSPPALQSDDLNLVMSSLAAHMAESYQLQVEVEAPDPCTVDDDSVRTLLYQGVRELLFNAVKHAGVERAAVRLWQDDGCCVIEVRDEGAGFDLEALQTQEQALHRAEGTEFGLPRLAERMELLGGEMVVETAPGEGTQVRLLVPASSGA